MVLNRRDLRELLDQFGTVNVVGEAFTVYKLGRGPGCFSAAPRTQVRAAAIARLLSKAIPSMTIEDAARRRDFTVNAILQDPLTGEIIDPFNGRADHRRGDPARRFAATRSPKTVCASCGPRSLRRALNLASSRKRSSFAAASIFRTCRRAHLGRDGKTAAARAPSFDRIGLAARTWRVLDQLFPEIKALIDVPQEPEWHPEGDVLSTRCWSSIARAN